MQIIQGQPGQFRHPQARSIQRFQQGLVPQSDRFFRIRARQQAFDFANTQSVRQDFPEPGRFHAFRDVPGDQSLLLQIAEKHLQADQPAGNGVGVESAVLLVQQKIKNGSSFDGVDGLNVPG